MKMDDARTDQAADQPDAALITSLDLEPEAPFPAWEQIERGRFMPRRVRGSFRGGVLG
jgi:hypothetical protein